MSKFRAEAVYRVEAEARRTPAEETVPHTGSCSAADVSVPPTG